MGEIHFAASTWKPLMPSLDHLATILYQSVMAVLVILGLLGLRRRMRAGQWLATTAVLVFCALLLARLLAQEKFLVMRLAAYGLFLHLGLWLAVSSVLMWRTLRWLSRLSALAAGLVVAVVADAFVWEPTWLEVTRVELRSPKLAERVRIVLLADIQTDAFTAYEQDVFCRALAEKPDLMLLAGDYLQAKPEERRRVGRQLNEFFRQLPLRAPRGVFAVRGNVDRDDWPITFQGLDVQMVAETETFDLGAIQLTCLSTDDSFRRDPALRAVSDAKYHVLLGHSPNVALGTSHADLTLAGHTHGGQVRLPLLGPVTTLSDVPRRHAAGLSERPAGGKLFVSRGIGLEREHAPRLRFLCRPQLVVIDLLPEREQE
jgi:predicted MPP superfamily phosphohydrolase